MVISENLVKAYAESYTRAELVSMRKDMLEKLAELEYISSASTGSGSAYQMQQRAQVEDMIELYTAAIHYQDGGEMGTNATAYRVIFH